LIAEAVPVQLALELPETVAPAEAEQAEQRYIGFREHPIRAASCAASTAKPATVCACLLGRSKGGSW
jgi:hypothetical protein